MTYIVENGIEKTVIRNREPLYLIENKEFNIHFGKVYREPKLTTLKRYMKSQNMIYTNDDTRFEYRRKGNEYYFAVNAANEIINELHEEIKRKI